MTRRASWAASRRVPAALVVMALVGLAGCAGVGIGGTDNGSMPFMNHTQTDGVYTGTNGSTPPTVTPGTATLTLTESSLVTVHNQTTNGSVLTIASVTVSDGGYVVVHDARREAAYPQTIIGVSTYLSPGTHENVTMRLFDVPGYDFGENAHLMGEVRVFVSLHHETTGNRTFEYVTAGTAADAPYRTDTGGIPSAFAGVTAHPESE